MNTDAVFACMQCGALKASFAGDGSDIECCGEVGQVEEVQIDEAPQPRRVEQ